MRIQTRLFLGTALLVLVLTGTQWLLHRRQLAAIERELGAVATAVGKGILDEELHVVVRHPGSHEKGPELTWVGDGAPPVDEGASAGADTLRARVPAQMQVLALRLRVEGQQ